MRPFLAFSKIASIMPCKGEIEKIPQITIIFALRGVVGSKGRNAVTKLEQSTPRKPGGTAETHTEEAATFLEQDSTTVPNFANRSFCPAGILLGLPPQTRLFAACAA